MSRCLRLGSGAIWARKRAQSGRVWLSTGRVFRLHKAHHVMRRPEPTACDRVSARGGAATRVGSASGRSYNPANVEDPSVWVRRPGVGRARAPRGLLGSSIGVAVHRRGARGVPRHARDGTREPVPRSPRSNPPRPATRRRLSLETPHRIRRKPPKKHIRSILINTTLVYSIIGLERPGRAGAGHLETGGARLRFLLRSGT
jgi:hypothetical protein